MILKVISQSNNVDTLNVSDVTTDSKGHYSLLFPHAQYNPIMFYKDGYSVFSTMNHKEDDYRLTVYLYNHSTGVLQSEDWGTNPSGDYHSTAVMRILDNGKIIAFAPSDHNTEIKIKVSDSAYDISSYTTTTSITGGSPAYPNVTKIDSRYYVFTRGFSQNNYICWTDNDGSTFTTPQKVSELPINKWAYPRGLYSTSKLRYCVMQRNQDTDGGWSNFYYYESTDGDTWSNLAGTFSKNVNTSGFITNSEMSTNYLLEDSGFVGSVAAKNNDEIIYHVDDYIKYTDSGSIVSVELTHNLYQGFKTQNKSQLLKKSETEWYLLCKATNLITSSYDIVLVHTTDLFSNITVTKLFEGDSYLTPNVSYNFQDGVQPLVVALERKVYGSGNLIDPDNSYSDFSYINNLNI